MNHPQDNTKVDGNEEWVGDTPTSPKTFVIGVELKPDILTHPNIPKPLHEVNPRNIMGKDQWDIVRQEVYKSSNYHCVACGVAKAEAKGFRWLEAHEYYHIDYENGRVEIESLQPLCHYCHNFIHSGRLAMIIGKDKTKQEVIDILEHGFKVLADNKLKAFPFTLQFAKSLGAETYGVKPYETNDSNVSWEDWRLIWDGKEYPPKYATYEDWQERYL